MLNFLLPNDDSGNEDSDWTWTLYQAVPALWVGRWVVANAPVINRMIFSPLHRPLHSSHYIGHSPLHTLWQFWFCCPQRYKNISGEKKMKCFDIIKGLNAGALFCRAGKLHLRDSIRRCVSKTGRKGLSVGGLALIGADQRKRLDPTVDEFPFPFIPPLTPTAWIVLL